MEIAGQDKKPKSANWIGTLNNPEGAPDTWLAAMQQQKGVRYVCGQLEQGKEGTPHI